MTGVLAKMTGREPKISAKCVIIAADGYGENKEFLKRYFPSETLKRAIRGVWIGLKGTEQRKKEKKDLPKAGIQKNRMTFFIDKKPFTFSFL